jgi:integrase
MGVFKRHIKSKDGTNTAYWYIRYSVNGRDKWESVGKVGEVTKTVAQRILEEQKRKLRMGIHDYEDATLEELEEDYLKYLAEVKQLRSWKGRAQHLNTLKSFFKGKKLTQITPKDVDELKLYLRETRKPATVNRYLSTLRQVFNLAKRWKMYYGENPVSIAGLLTEDNYRNRVLTPEEETRLLAYSAEHLKPILITALNTGMRRGEVLSLKWSNVDFENNMLIINALNNKSKRVKRIPLNHVMSTILKELKLKNQKLSEYVFLSDDSKQLKDIKTAFLNACRRANIQGLRFHDLRHTAGTRMQESGVGIVEITKILGNTSLEMTMKRYVHPEESLRSAVDKLADFNKDCSNNCSNEKDGTS